MLEAHSEGLICLSRLRVRASSASSSSRSRLAEADEAGRVVPQASSANDFYVEIQNNGLDIQKQLRRGGHRHRQRSSACRSWPPATPTTCRRTTPTPTTCCSASTRARRSTTRTGCATAATSSTSAPPEEMYAAVPRATRTPVERSQEIADGVRHRARLQEAALPVFTPPAGKTPEEYLRELCEAGLQRALRRQPVRRPRGDRLEHELGIIYRMGFASYFLIVWDFVRFARENGIPRSARGSACGAIVSYVLKLSHVCPLEYDLLFERFLDPNRSRGARHRHRLLPGPPRARSSSTSAEVRRGERGPDRHVRHWRPRRRIKDVGRVLDIPLERVNALTKHDPEGAEHHARRGARAEPPT